MPSSTSSFKRSIPGSETIKLLLVGLLGGLLLTLAMENIFRILGAMPNVKDTSALWTEQRREASRGDGNKITIVGASRAQLGIDIEELERLSGSRIIQLAIDGSPYYRILENLANDSAVNGTVLISTDLQSLSPAPTTEHADQWLADYESGASDSSFLQLENSLVTRLQSASALYANIVPLDTVARSILGLEDFPINYVTTRRNRERDADHQLVAEFDVYVGRVMRTLNLSVTGGSFPDLDQFDQAILAVARTAEADNPTPASNLGFVKAQIAKLRQRGARVVVVHFPISGAVEGITDIRYPKAAWERHTSELDAIVIDYRDYPELDYELVDGSHLDVRQKTDFTRDLYQIISASSL
jgi:hypothetical protein